MTIELGSKVYYYTLDRNAKIHVHECEVQLHGKHMVVLIDEYRAKLLKAIDFDIVQANRSVRVWLRERNDELAKKLFLEYEEESLAELQEQIKKKSEKIKTLKGES